MEKIINKLRVVEYTEATICNKCGGDCYGEGLPETHLSGGWNSCFLGDNSRYSFAICEECLWGIFQTFKIKPLSVCSYDDIAKVEKAYDSWVEHQPKHTARMREDPNWLQEAIKFDKYSESGDDEKVEEFLKAQKKTKVPKKRKK